MASSSVGLTPPHYVFGVEKQPFFTEAYAYLTAGNVAGPGPVAGVELLPNIGELIGVHGIRDSSPPLGERHPTEPPWRLLCCRRL